MAVTRGLFSVASARGTIPTQKRETGEEKYSPTRFVRL
jgi:hypothetical protein